MPTKSTNLQSTLMAGQGCFSGNIHWPFFTKPHANKALFFFAIMISLFTNICLFYFSSHWEGMGRDNSEAGWLVSRLEQNNGWKWGWLRSNLGLLTRQKKLEKVEETVWSHLRELLRNVFLKAGRGIFL